ncbi:MAG: T9SS type A sorting domain-containing protein [Bacteroides sp.]|nr:T9SS type A sorting domain-containing protein [Bacteroides sp.]
MKKLLFSSLALGLWLSCLADGQNARITTSPSPAVSNKPVEVTITTGDLGSEVFCYTWCKSLNGVEKNPEWTWDGVNTDKFRMNGSNGNYTFTINSIKEFYGLTDDELAGLTSLGFIAKNTYGGQTSDLFIEVVQGRRDAYSGGEGTPESPFILKTPADLKAFAETPADWGAGCFIRLESDIDASAITGSIGSKSIPFSATFDGNGYCIKNLDLHAEATGSAAGLFGVVKGGTIIDLGLTDAAVEGKTYVGLLAGYLESGSIERCFTSGTVSGTSICVGGLVGENVAGVVRDCYSGAKVINSEDYATGGLAGKNSGVISNTYAAGEVEGYDYVGGLIGANYGTVKNSVALNKSVTAYNDFVARFGGNNNSRNISSDNYSWDEIKAGHFAWTTHGDHALMQYSTDLRNTAKFESLTGWDFENVWEWKTDNGREFPALRGMTGQKCPLPELYFQISTAVEGVGDVAAVMVGPNPTSGELRITSGAGIMDYALFTLNGSTVLMGDGAAATDISIDLSDFGAGLYILQVAETGGSKSIFKIVKK